MTINKDRLYVTVYREQGIVYQFLSDLTPDELIDLDTAVDQEKEARRQGDIIGIEIIHKNITFISNSVSDSAFTVDIDGAKRHILERRTGNDVLITWTDESPIGIVNYILNKFMVEWADKYKPYDVQSNSMKFKTKT